MDQQKNSIRRKAGQADSRSASTMNSTDAASPLDVKGVDLDVTTLEIVALIREGRERA